MDNGREINPRQFVRILKSTLAYFINTHIEWQLGFDFSVKIADIFIYKKKKRKEI